MGKMLDAPRSGDHFEGMFSDPKITVALEALSQRAGGDGSRSTALSTMKSIDVFEKAYAEYSANYKGGRYKGEVAQRMRDDMEALAPMRKMLGEVKEMLQAELALPATDAGELKGVSLAVGDDLDTIYSWEKTNKIALVKYSGSAKNPFTRKHFANTRDAIDSREGVFVTSMISLLAAGIFSTIALVSAISGVFVVAITFSPMILPALLFLGTMHAITYRNTFKKLPEGDWRKVYKKQEIVKSMEVEALNRCASANGDRVFSMHSLKNLAPAEENRLIEIIDEIADVPRYGSDDVQRVHGRELRSIARSSQQRARIKSDISVSPEAAELESFRLRHGLS